MTTHKVMVRQMTRCLVVSGVAAAFSFPVFIARAQESHVDQSQTIATHSLIIRKADATEQGDGAVSSPDYTNLPQVLPDASRGAGMGEIFGGAQGYVSPTQIKSVVAKGHSRLDYAQGIGGFADLARSGEAALKPLPDSSTAGRAYAMHLLSGGLGAGGLAVAGPVSVAAALAAPAAIGRLIMSRPIQAYLGNQWLQHGFNPPTVGSAIAALLGTKRETPGSSVGALLAGR